MKTYEDLRKDGFTPTEALEILNTYPNDYIHIYLEHQMNQLANFIGVPDIALNDYDYLEDELFL